MVLIFLPLSNGTYEVIFCAYILMLSKSCLLIIVFMFYHPAESDGECEKLVCYVSHSECVKLISGEEKCVCKKGFSGDGSKLCKGMMCYMIIIIKVAISSSKRWQQTSSLSDLIDTIQLMIIAYSSLYSNMV